MNKVLYVDAILDKAYKNNTFLGRLKDNFYRNFEGKSYISNLDTIIYKVKLPPNFNEQAFKRNIYKIRKKFNNYNISTMALSTNRFLDYNFYTEFQKKFLAYSVVKSIQLLLRTRNKSIRKNYIAVYDSIDIINKYIVLELSKNSKCLILVSNNMRKNRELCDHITRDYGVSPIITDDIKYVSKHSDFIISSKPLDCLVECPLWCLDNMYIPKERKDIVVNKVTYTTPWDFEDIEVTSELLGGIFNYYKEEEQIDQFLYNKGILIKDAKFESFKNL